MLVRKRSGESDSADSGRDGSLLYLLNNEFLISVPVASVLNLGSGDDHFLSCLPVGTILDENRLVSRIGSGGESGPGREELNAVYIDDTFDIDACLD